MNGSSQLDVEGELANATLNLSPIIKTSLVALSVYVVFSYVISYWRLRHIPGPRIAAWTNLWYIRNTVSGELYKRHAAACAKYGPLVRIGPSTVVTSDPQLIRDMNGVRTKFTKSYWYKAFRFDADKDNLVSVVDDELHTSMRNKLAPGYGGKDNPNLERDVDTVLWSLFHLIQRKYTSKGSNLKPLDWGIMAQYLTLDVITNLGLGEAFGWVADDEDKFEYVTTWTANIPIVSFLSSVPWITRLMTHPSIQPYLVPSVKERAGLGAIKAAARAKIIARYENDGKIKSQSTTVASNNEDMIQSFINHGLSTTEVADESLLQIVAGSDTTASAIRTAILYIISHPQVYRKLQAECDAAALPYDKIVSDNQATKLPYLTACIRETLRIRTPVAGMLPRVTPKEGYHHAASGLYIPPGTTVGMAMWNVQYDPTVFGSDVSSFRPERWLEDDGDKGGTITNSQRTLMEKTNELNFGYGKHRCLGERIAKLELYKVVFEMIRRYELSFVDFRNPIKWEANYGLWYMKGMNLRVEERDPESSLR